MMDTRKSGAKNVRPGKTRALHGKTKLVRTEGTVTIKPTIGKERNTLLTYSVLPIEETLERARKASERKPILNAKDDNPLLTHRFFDISQVLQRAFDAAAGRHLSDFESVKPHDNARRGKQKQLINKRS